MAQGIQLAGGYGAGGAKDALVELIAQKLTQQKFGEQVRARMNEEQLARETLGQRKTEATAEDLRAKAGLRENQRQFGETLGLNVKKLGEDTRQFDVSTGENRRQFDTGLEFKKGEATRDQGNTERGFGLKERQLTEEERSNRAGEGIASARVGAAGSTRTVKITRTDPETGQTFEEYVTPQEARERGPILKGMGAKDVEAGNAMSDYVKKIDEALALGKKSGWAGTGVVEGRTAGLLGGAFASEEALNLRALIGDLFAENAHERFGGALTAQEIGRAKAYLAEVTDDPKKIKVNLERMKSVVAPALERWRARKGTGDGGGNGGTSSAWELYQQRLKGGQ